MKQSPKLSPKAALEQAGAVLRNLRGYSVIFFLLLLAAVYGFVLFKVNGLIGLQPNDADVQSQIQASATPHVDAATVKQIEDLNDNNVSVQSLFDQARSNPFQE
jgi:glycosyltransferase A (GT-A) superfamily protein (DUF2064 family)